MTTVLPLRVQYRFCAGYAHGYTYWNEYAKRRYERASIRVVGIRKRKPNLMQKTCAKCYTMDCRRWKQQIRSFHSVDLNIYHTWYEKSWCLRKNIPALATSSTGSWVLPHPNLGLHIKQNPLRIFNWDYVIKTSLFNFIEISSSRLRWAYQWVEKTYLALVINTM